MHVERFESMTNAELVEHFHTARRQDCETLDCQLSELLQEAHADAAAEARQRMLETLEKLRKRHAELSRIDFFGSPEGAAVAARLTELGQVLTAGQEPEVEVRQADAQAFRQRTWVTRPRPHVDRLASIWLIRRFIDPEAAIRYADAATEGDVSFDMPGAQFGHMGNLCTFETLMHAFGLSDAGLRAIAEIIHELDLCDGRYARPEMAGLEAILDGWRQSDLADEELEQHGAALFEGLYLHLMGRYTPSPLNKESI